MIIIGIVLSFFGIGFMCWLLFTHAVYALPCFVSAAAFFAAFHNGTYVAPAVIIGLVAGVFAAAAGRLTALTIRMPIVCAAIGLLFATPVALAGYNATLGLAAIGISSHALGMAVAVLGAVMVGCTALARMTFAAPILVGLTPAGHPGRYPLTRHDKKAMKAVRRRPY